MEIVNENCALLSNYEVFSLLTDIQKGENGQKKPNKYLTSLATVTFETVKYLEKTSSKDLNPEIVGKFLEAVKPFKLTRAEKLQLLNHRPGSAVEIQLLIEESEERLSEEQIEQLLEIISETLPGQVEQQGAEEQT